MSHSVLNGKSTIIEKRLQCNSTLTLWCSVWLSFHGSAHAKQLRHSSLVIFLESLSSNSIITIIRHYCKDVSCCCLKMEKYKSLCKIKWIWRKLFKCHKMHNLSCCHMSVYVTWLVWCSFTIFQWTFCIFAALNHRRVKPTQRCSMWGNVMHLRTCTQQLVTSLDYKVLPQWWEDWTLVTLLYNWSFFSYWSHQSEVATTLKWTNMGV